MLKAEEEHQTALKEKETLEKMLAHHQEELNRGISFQQEKERMELALLEKDMECRLLQRALDGLRAQHNESGNQDSKNEVVKLFSDMVETELQCSICSELFVKVCLNIKFILIGLARGLPCSLYYSQHLRYYPVSVAESFSAHVWHVTMGSVLVEVGPFYIGCRATAL